MRSLMGGSPLRESIYRALFRERFQLIYFVAENLLSVFNFLSYIYVKFHVVTESSLYTLSAGIIHTANKDTTAWLCQVVTYKTFPDVSKSRASHMHWNLDYALLICDCHYCDCLELLMFVLKLNLMCVCPRLFCYAYPDEDEAIPKIDFKH